MGGGCERQPPFAARIRRTAGVNAVATRGGYAAIGDLDRQAVAKVYPRAGRHGQYRGLLAGRAIPGDRHRRLFPSAEPQPARIELWGLSDDRVAGIAGLRGLAGRLRRRHRLECAPATGSPAQPAWPRRRPASSCNSTPRNSGRRSFFEADLGRFGPAELRRNRESPGSHLAVVFRGGFRDLDAWDGKEAWRADRLDMPDLLQDFDHDPENRRDRPDQRPGPRRPRRGREIAVPGHEGLHVDRRPARRGLHRRIEPGRIYCWE